MLTEVGHGLDARNLETTATLQPDGSFDLHTPNDAAAKGMPPTTPNSGIPRVAVVFARLKVHGEDYGIKPFVVWLCDSDQMRRGITSRALPMRPGTTSKPLDHAITTFDHVRLSPNALLGSISKPKDGRDDFLQHIWRVSIGTLSLSILGVSVIKVGTHIAALYSQRRMVASSNGRGHVPIMSFSTQQRPILDGWAYGIVLESYARWTVKEFMNPRHSRPVRHALATIFKATITRASGLLNELAERCGWQGLFSYNQISELALSFQGTYIAEGDTLVLCIRKLFTSPTCRVNLTGFNTRSCFRAPCREICLARAARSFHAIGTARTRKNDRCKRQNCRTGWLQGTQGPAIQSTHPPSLSTSCRGNRPSDVLRSSSSRFGSLPNGSPSL
jgi:alkylation response protein AidB-like acyl-CoA dehydrogenase